MPPLLREIVGGIPISCLLHRKAAQTLFQKQPVWAGSWDGRVAFFSGPCNDSAGPPQSSGLTTWRLSCKSERARSPLAWANSWRGRGPARKPGALIRKMPDEQPVGTARNSKLWTLILWRYQHRICHCELRLGSDWTLTLVLWVRLQALEERASTAEEALEASKSGHTELRASFEAVSKEVAEVKQRARALLEDKDAQLQAARVNLSESTLQKSLLPQLCVLASTMMVQSVMLQTGFEDSCLGDVNRER